MFIFPLGFFNKLVIQTPVISPVDNKEEKEQVDEFDLINFANYEDYEFRNY